MMSTRFVSVSHVSHVSRVSRVSRLRRVRPLGRVVVVRGVLAFATAAVGAFGIGCASTPPSTAVAAGTLGEAAQKWADAQQPQSFVDFFRGTFTRLGITVAETGEQFTVVHQGDRFAFEAGAADVEFVVPIGQHNVDSLLKRASDGVLDDVDAYEIMAVLFTPLTREILKHPVTADDTLRQLSGVEDHIHVTLLDDQGAPGASHTLTYSDGVWRVENGLVGTPLRSFRMNAQQALEYQRHAYEAIKTNSPLGWSAFSSWYKAWRETCSSTTAA